MLGRGVGRRVRARRVRGDRAVVDDPPAARRLRLHRPEGRLRAQERAREVDVDDLLPVRVRRCPRSGRRREMPALLKSRSTRPNAVHGARTAPSPTPGRRRRWHGERLFAAPAVGDRLCRAAPAGARRSATRHPAVEQRERRTPCRFRCPRRSPLPPCRSSPASFEGSGTPILRARRHRPLRDGRAPPCAAGPTNVVGANPSPC